ncbi:MAG: hypothetical protein GX447_08085 [Elusimicrobia bacterium]|nr:hypothetical protein [Elusimicrobiota bacterium]
MSFLSSFLYFYGADNFKELSLFLILMPTVLGILSFLVSSNAQRRSIIFIGSIFHFLITGILVLTLANRDLYAVSNFPVLILNSFSGNIENAVFLSVVSLLFSGASFYSLKYLKLEEKNIRKDDEGFLINDEPEAVFTGFMMFFLSAMTLVCFSAHMGLLWAAVEATTLFSAPLIYFHRSRRSLEATWKYLVVCSVGIAIALLGTFFLSLSGGKSGGSLYFYDIISQAKNFNPLWLKLSFIFFFVGYGTKMGLAPLHTWLPDAHSEAPSVVSALLSGALLNCAFLGIWKSYSFMRIGGLGEFSSSIMIFFGIFTVFISALFILNQKEYKRALAYSSVENMGLMCLLLGISFYVGREAEKLVFLSAIGHSLIKSGMFFIAGMVLFYYKSKKYAEVGPMFSKTPFTAGMWFLGFILLSGAPPSPLFFPKLFIFKFMLLGGKYFISALMIFLFIIIFAGLGKIFYETIFSGANNLQEIKEDKTILFPSLSFFSISIFIFFAFFYFSRGIK